MRGKTVSRKSMESKQQCRALGRRPQFRLLLLLAGRDGVRVMAGDDDGDMIDDAVCVMILILTTSDALYHVTSVGAQYPRRLIQLETASDRTKVSVTVLRAQDDDERYVCSRLCLKKRHRCGTL